MSGTSTDAQSAGTGFLMWRAANAWQRAQRAALEPLGITHVQYALLAALATDDARRGLSQAEISQRTGVDPMTTSQVIRNLEGRELVLRTASETDRRAQRVSLTSAGRALVRKAQPRVDRTDAEFFSALGRHQSTVAGALATLADR